VSFRRALIALVAAATVLGTAACGGGGRPHGLKIGVAYDYAAPGDTTFTNTAKGAINVIKGKLGSRIADVREFSAKADDTEDDRYDRLIILCQSGYDPVIAAGPGYAGLDPATGPLARAAKTCPKTRFAIVDDTSVSAPNVANLVFGYPQGGYLAGVVAARETRTGKVGFVGGCRIPLVTAFETGYWAGVKATRPDVQQVSRYLATDPSQCHNGFDDKRAARAGADLVYGAGVDVAFEVAGSADMGVVQSAKAHDAKMIASYVDLHRQLDATLRDQILTSIVMRIDIMLNDFVRGVLAGKFTAGVSRWDLSNTGLGYTTSGNWILDLVPELNTVEKGLADGTIALPAGSS
jgi:basic membrane protein A and related proteins